MANQIPMRLTVNGREVEARVSPDLFLMDYLRDELRLTSVKNGCAQGHCEGRGLGLCCATRARQGARRLGKAGGHCATPDDIVAT